MNLNNNFLCDNLQDSKIKFDFVFYIISMHCGYIRASTKTNFINILLQIITCYSRKINYICTGKHEKNIFNNHPTNLIFTDSLCTRYNPLS